MEKIIITTILKQIQFVVWYEPFPAGIYTVTPLKSVELLLKCFCRCSDAHYIQTTSFFFFCSFESELRLSSSNQLVWQQFSQRISMRLKAQSCSQEVWRERSLQVRDESSVLLHSDASSSFCQLILVKQSSLLTPDSTLLIQSHRNKEITLRRPFHSR